MNIDIWSLVLSLISIILGISSIFITILIYKMQKEESENQKNIIINEIKNKIVKEANINPKEDFDDIENNSDIFYPFPKF